MRHLHPHQVVVHAQRQSLYAEAVDWNWRVLSLGDGLEDVDTARLEGREYDGLDARGSLGKGSKLRTIHSHPSRSVQPSIRAASDPLDRTTH